MSVVIGITTGWAKEQLVTGWSLVYTVKGCVERIEKAGAIPLLLPCVEEQDTRSSYLKLIDGLLVAGEVISIKNNSAVGAIGQNLRTQNPYRYENEEYFIRQAFNLNMPILGICRGHQMLADVLGGELQLEKIDEQSGGVVHQQGSKPSWETNHPIRLIPGTKIANILRMMEVEVNSYHKQAVKTCPPGFAPTAVAPDGIIEAMENQRDVFVMGVQFHPETLEEKIWAPLFKEFIKNAEHFKLRKK